MLIIIILGLIFSSYAFEVKLCDCTRPTGIGLLTFANGNCEPATKTGKTPVNYQVMADKKRLIIFQELYVQDDKIKSISQRIF
jgi:hypothetical protein